MVGRRAPAAVTYFRPHRIGVGTSMSGKIVIADDERDILDSTADVLRLSGYHVVTVQRTEQILDVLRRERPDLLLQDCAMPNLDVDRLLDSIRADSSLASLAVMLFTGSVDARAAAKRLHVQGYLEKPLDIDVLRTQIAKVLKAPKSSPGRQPGSGKA